MSRRVSRLGLILVLAIWSGVLLSPPMRLLLRAQAAPQWTIFLQKLGVRDEGFARVLRENPNDARVLAVEIESATTSEDWSQDSYVDRRKIQLKKYDQLIEKFPEEEWLIQNRLRTSMIGGFAMDDGEFSDSRYRRIGKNIKPWMTRAEMLQGLKIAERGVRLDSQNSFYDWMRAILLFGLRRDAQALQALQQGSRKSHYDDGVLRDAQNRVYVEELKAPLLWENRVAISAAILLPHYAIMRTANRASIWRGVLAERKSDHKNALEIYSAQMRLARLMRRDSTNFIGVAVGEAMVQGAWGGIARKRNPSQDQGGEAWGKGEKDRLDLAARFASYARQHERKDLAAEALRDVGEFEVSKNGNWFESFWFGIASKTVQPMVRLHWTNSMLLRPIAVCILAWLILNTLLWRVRLHPDLSCVSWLDVASSALFVGVACAVVFIATLMDANWMDLMRGNDQIFFDEHTKSELLNVAPQIISWLPLVLTIFYCGVVMLWRGRGKILSVADSDIEENSSPKKAARFLAQAAFIIAIFISSLWWWNWLWAQNLIYAITFPGLLLPILVGWISHRKLQRLLAWRPKWNVIYGFAWSRSTLGALVVIGSIAYFVCALFALPLRKEADARMDEYIAKGEVALMREGMDK